MKVAFLLTALVVGNFAFGFSARADRVVTEADIKRAMGACWKVQAEDLFQQVFHKNPASSEITSSTTDSRPGQSEYDPRPLSRQNVSINVESDGNHLKLTMASFLKWNYEHKSTEFALLEIVYGNGSADDTDVVLGTGVEHGSYQQGNLFNRHEVAYTDYPARLPYFSYEQKVTDAAYDKAGNPVSGRYLAKNLHLIVPANQDGSHGSSIKLYNRMTEHITSLRFNEDKLLACLRSKI